MAAPPHRPRAWIAAGLVAGLSLAGPADGQTRFADQVPPSIVRSMSADIDVQRVRDKVFAYDRRIHQACDDRHMTGWSPLTPVQDPLTRDYQARGAETVYRQQVTVAGCGAPPRLHNLLVITARDPIYPPKLTAAVPGTTRTWPHLQYHVQHFFLAYVMNRSGGLCLDAFRQGHASPVVLGADMGDAVEPVETGPGGVVVKGVWTERWKARLCDRRFQETLLFEADSRGGANYALLGGRPIAKALTDLRATAGPAVAPE